MNEINIEWFKSEFKLISELIVSFDQDHMAILKSRKEIDAYLESQTPELQETIIEKLNQALFMNALSESYLLNYRKENGTIPFDKYLEFKLKSVKQKIEHNQFLLNDGLINNLKEKLKGLISKDAKINFLLDKKRDLEGDYPKDFGEILTEDDYYLFLIRELEYWKEYREVTTNEPKKPQQLITKLTESQKSLLFDLLVEGGFIADDTDRDGFKWALGSKNNKFTSFKITWLSKSNLAVYLIDTLFYDPASTIPLWEIGSKIFSIKNMAQIKQGYLNNNISRPKGSEAIDDIVSEINGAK